MDDDSDKFSELSYCDDEGATKQELKTNHTKPNLIDVSRSNEKPKIIPHPNLMVRHIDLVDEDIEIKGKEE